jgi:hypothetical protein
VVKCFGGHTFCIWGNKTEFFNWNGKDWGGCASHQLVHPN